MYVLHMTNGLRKQPKSRGGGWRKLLTGIRGGGGYAGSIVAINAATLKRVK